MCCFSFYVILFRNYANKRQRKDETFFDGIQSNITGANIS